MKIGLPRLEYITNKKYDKSAEIYKEYQNKIQENASSKSAYKEISIINLVESDYEQIVKIIIFVESRIIKLYILLINELFRI